MPCWQVTVVLALFFRGLIGSRTASVCKELAQSGLYKQALLLEGTGEQSADLLDCIGVAKYALGDARGAIDTFTQVS